MGQLQLRWALYPTNGESSGALSCYTKVLQWRFYNGSCNKDMRRGADEGYTEWADIPAVIVNATAPR